MTRLTKAQQEEQATAVRNLKEWLPDGTTVYTVLRHRSASGMQRSISLVTVIDGEIRDLDYWAARALEYKLDNDRGGLKVHGCGMDMGFHVVYSLSACLFGHDDRGGYKLNHRWL